MRGQRQAFLPGRAAALVLSSLAAAMPAAAQPPEPGGVAPAMGLAGNVVGGGLVIGLGYAWLNGRRPSATMAAPAAAAAPTVSLGAAVAAQAPTDASELISSVQR